MEARTDGREEVSKEQFLAYEAVRESGVTNMWDTSTVSDLSGLDRETVLDVIANYGSLAEKYLVVR